MKIVSSEAMAEIDRRSQAEFAFPSTVLMEDTGLKAWGIMKREISPAERTRGTTATAGGAQVGGAAGRLVFVAGGGNNGGDALVMARRAAVEGGRAVTVILAGARPSPGSDPGRMLAMCEALGLECLPWPGEPAGARLAEAGWIVDGLAGTGLRGSLRAPLAGLVTTMNAAAGRRIALDVPSGVGDGFREGNPAVRAEITLTMGLPKACLYLPRARAFCGRIVVVHVGFPPALLESAEIVGELLTRSSWRERLLPVPADTHKNLRGHLAVFAGASGTTGAAWLCASAAARCRVGLVTVFADAQAYPVLAPKLTSVMCRPWDGSPVPAGWNPEGFSAVLAGPGWGTADEKERFLESVLSFPRGGVIDADGLALLKRILDRSGTSLGGRWVLTPHPGEFSRLTGLAKDEVLDDPVGHALSLSSRVGAVVVLKGHSTIVAAPDGRYWVLDGANPALATGGAGDVLAGIIAAGCATGLGALDAALFGVSLHSHVARVAARRVGWFLAEDLVPLLSTVLKPAVYGGGPT